MTRRHDNGVILVNVLVALALGAALVVLMLTTQDNLLDRARRAAALAQAQALALGAELSVVSALRADMQTAPDVDHFAEPWALTQQAAVQIGTGQFSVVIRDAQAGFDLNGLAAGGIAQQQVLNRLVAALNLPPETAPRILAGVTRRGPLHALADIAELDAGTRVTLAPFVSFLPSGGSINLNTAALPVLAAVLGNQTAARRLVALRDRTGFLTPDNLRDLGLLGTAGAGFRSAVFDVTVTAAVDDVTTVLTSRIQRVQGLGTQDVRVVARRFGPAPENPAMPLPPDF